MSISLNKFKGKGKGKMLQSKRSPQSTERCMPKHHELHKKGSKFNEDKENTIPDTLVVRYLVYFVTENKMKGKTFS